jgi:CDP-diacylglycerol--glycerol-3-phosphate 3-phosphatidyltransferase
MANLVTLSRIGLLVIVVWLMYLPPGWWQSVSFWLVILIFVSDAVDGYLARKRNTASHFGALFDIAGDRIVEVTIFVVAADLDLIPIWVPLVFIFRGIVVDTIRSSESQRRSVTPFGMMASDLGERLVASQFMRVAYALVKCFAFCGLVSIRAFPVILPTVWGWIDWLWTGTTYVTVYLALAICVLRGLPVVVEFIYSERGAK